MQLSYAPTIKKTIPPFHALVGSDVTSFLLGHSKKTSWTFFKGDTTKEGPRMRNSLSADCAMSKTWMQLSTTKPSRIHGVNDEEGKPVPILISFPHAPKSYIYLMSCGCTTGCRNLRCKCMNSDLIYHARPNTNVAVVFAVISDPRRYN